jgi:YHS domain-containing protein
MRAIDPVCGRVLERETALLLEVEGRTLAFCSEECRSAYSRDVGLRPLPDPLAEEVVAEAERLAGSWLG